MKRMHEMPFGAAVRTDGSVRFALWAPQQAGVTLEVASVGEFPMKIEDGGWHRLVLDRRALAQAAPRYKFRFADGLAAPDPASRYNPDDVHGHSAVIDPRNHVWRDDGVSHEQVDV